MANAEESVGEALVSLLEKYGVDTVFGIPGVHNVEMYRALPRSRIRHVLPRHEQGAGFMAHGYAFASRKPGVCFTITGPGLTNILTPIGQAWSDSVPMLVISSALDVVDASLGRGRLHEMRDQRAAAAATTASATIAYTGRDVQDAIGAAFAGFATARPRPAYVEIPLDVLSQPAGDGWTARPAPRALAPSPEDIEQAVRILESASTPLLVLGGGARHAQGIASLAERLEALIVTTVVGKGIVPDSHPLHLGAFLPTGLGSQVMAGADVILAAGTELAETDFWSRSFDVRGKLIRIDLDPDSLARPYPADLPIRSDAALALSAIATRLGGGKRPSRHAEAAELRRRFAAEDEGLRTTFRPLLAVIRESLPADTFITCDSTQIAYAANEIFPIDMAASWLYPMGFGTLGFALPAAIGARVALPERPVAAMIGDYGFQYTVNELATAVEAGGPLVILLWRNDALAQIRDDMVRKGIQPNAVTMRNPDFQLLARAYGCHAERPTNAKALSSAIATALKADRPTIVEMTSELLR